MFLTAVVLSSVALAGRAEPPIPHAHPDTLCQVLHPDRVPVQGRKSPLDSLTFTVGKRPVKLCYGRPSSRGRVMVGGKAVPYGRLWRTGANEPTIFFNPLSVTLAGLKLAPGMYSLYTVPGAAEWQVIVNRSVSQWGEESNYTPQVQAQEVGRATVKTETLVEPIETFTIRAEPGPAGAASLVLEWERSRIRIPIKPA
jgi:DUF2911 family protein